jgi:hypothetical protein
MMEVILKYLKVIAEAWKGILAIGGIITVVATLAVKDAEKNRKLNILVDTQKIIVDSIGSFSRQMQPMKIEIGQIKDGMVEYKNAYNGLRQVVLDHTGKTPGMTIEQFKLYMESTPELLKKNDSYNYLYIPPMVDTQRILQSLTLK